MPARATMRITARSRPPPASARIIGRSESIRQFLERRLGAQRVHRRLLRVEVLLESVLDRGVAERIQRAEVVAHRRNVGLGGIRELSERDPLLAAFSELVERNLH